MSVRATIGRVLGSWIPVLALYLIILATLPFGTFIAHTLYRLGPDIITARVVVNTPAAEVVQLPTGLVVRHVDGTLSYLVDEKPQPAPELVAPCQELGFFRGSQQIVCPLGCDGVAVLHVDESGELVSRSLEPGGEATAGVAVGTTTVIGTADGRVVFFDGDQPDGAVEVGTDPVRRIRMFQSFIAVMVGEDLIVLSPRTRQELARIPLGAPALDFDRGYKRYYALTERTLWSLDLTDPAAPRVLDQLDTPAPATRLKFVAPSVGAVSTKGRGTYIMRDAPIGPMWWGRKWGELATATQCGGGWTSLVCVGEGVEGPQVQVYDPFGYRNVVVGGVGLFALSVILALVFALILGRPSRWPVRLAWLLVGIGILSAMLVGTLHTPVEALHVLEYGLLGLLIFRAVSRELGGGFAAALLAVAIGWSAGLVDETIQWVYPGRTGAIEDVFLDAQATTVGIGIAWLALHIDAMKPPISWAWPLVALGLILPANLGLVHVTAGFGHAHAHEDLRWTSALTRDELAAREGDAEARAALERSRTMDYSDFLNAYEEDPYIYELAVRLYRRDQRLVRGDPMVACAEDRILAHVFSDTLAATDYAWTDAERALCPDLPTNRMYVSPVGAGRITWAPPWLLWSGVLVLALLLGAGGIALAWWQHRRARRRSRRS